MNKRILLTLLILLTVVLSASAISASDVSVTDSYTTDLVDDTQDASVPLKNTADSSEISVSSDSSIDNDPSKVSLSSEEVLESENSNTLSTNTESNSIGESNATTKTDTKLTSQTTSIYYKGSYSITLKDSNGKAVAGKTINFVINGVKYNGVTNSNGVASVALSLNPGKYTAKASFAGDDNYTAASDISSTISILATVQSKDITKYYKGSTQYTATFYTSQGKALANTNVKITVNGKTYTKKTNSKGVASLSINLKPGSYKVVAVDPKTGYKLTTTFKILTTISASDISKVYTDGKKFTAKFLKSNGKVLAKKTIKFKINGKTYKVKTNAKGVASLSLKTLKKGTYKIISYNTDGLTKTNKVKVVKSTTSKLTTSSYKFLTSDSKTIKVTLLNGLGYAPGSGKIIKITINGKTYSKKTNSNGVASLKLPSLKAGIYTVKYKFAGNSFYKASSASNKVTIYSTKTPTFTVKSGTTFTYGSSNTFKVAVTSGSVPVQSKAVTFKVDDKTYTKNTDSNGVASLPIDLVIGKHTISYSIAKESKLNAKSASSSITIKEKAIKTHNAYWLDGSDMKSVNLKDLSSKGVTDVLLNFKAYELYGKSGVETWISSANSVGIDVHMWVQAFYSGDTGWVNPVKDGKENTAYFTTKLNEIKTYAAIKGLSGIHLDYLRYSGVESSNNAAFQNNGGTEAINSFVKQVRSTMDSVNKNLVLSCALMPETTSSKYYYGQDYETLSQVMDVVVPMVYKGNYGKSSDWITSTAQWYVDNSKGANVWVGIQTYKSDNDTTKLSTSALTTDVASAIKSGADGVVLFRYGISNDINFNSATTSSAAVKTISIKNIVTGATNLKNYYESNKKLPNTVTTGGYTFTLPEFLYLMSQAIYQLNNKNTKDVTVLSGVSAPTSPSGANINSKDLKTYAEVAKKVIDYINNNKRAPNHASSDVGNIIYSEVVDAFSRVLAFYGSNNRLPGYVTISYGSGSSSSLVSGTGLNEVNKLSSSDLKAYLQATKNCQVNDAAITKKVNELTKGLTSDSAKATAIFNWVRDTLSYSFYYDTKYGASKTLSNKAGNCVDHSHLLVAMFRSAGLEARYVHGKCTFTSGSTYGHVWVQVLVDNTWTVADATSSKNKLGVVNNWNTKTFTLNGIYRELSF